MDAATSLYDFLLHVPSTLQNIGKLLRFFQSLRLTLTAFKPQPAGSAIGRLTKSILEIV